MTSTHFAAIYFADPYRAQQLSDLLSERGVDSKIAQNSEDLYHLLNYRPVDFVLLENELRGFLTGLDILQRVFQDLLKPTTILLARPTVELRLKAQELGIDLILPPDCSIEQMGDAVVRLMAEVKVQQVLIPTGARRVVQAFDRIKPLPQVMVKLSMYLDAAEISSHQLADDISTDAKSTADLLKLANSSAVGLQRKVSNVFDAIKYLGNRRTIGLLLSQGLLSSQNAFGSSTPLSERTWYNHRSVLIASTASLFAEHFEELSPQTAYVLGLLQDIGILVLVNAHHRRYLQLLRRFRGIGPLRLEVIEQQEFGYNHAHVSAAVLQKWGLPGSMVNLVLNHHESYGGERSRTEQRFLHVMALGEAFANLADGHVAHRYAQLHRCLSDYETGTNDKVKSCLAEAVAKAMEAKQIFALPLPDGRKIEALMKRIQAGDASLRDYAAQISAEEEAQSHAQVQYQPAASTVDLPSAISPHRFEQRPKVLVIDDEPLVVDLLCRILGQVNLEGVSCESSEKARELAESTVAALIDVHLVGESGIDLTKSLRASGYDRPIIVVTGDRTRETVGKCLLAGATDYLTKPIDEQALYQKLSRHTGLNLVIV